MSEQEARDTTTSAERLEVLSEDPALRILVASNPAAPETLLETLARDPDARVRERVAGNPNTPWPTLEQLAWEFPQAFLHNPVAQLCMLAHPEQINTDYRFWEAQMRVASIPSFWWDWFWNYLDLGDSQALNAHIEVTGEAPHPYGARPGTSEHDLLALVELLSIACDHHMSLPPLLSETPAGQELIPGEHILQERLQWLAQSASNEIQAEVARNKRTPETVLQALAEEKSDSWGNWLVRMAVAENARVPVETLGMLARDQNTHVREAVAKQKRAPAEVLQILVTDQEWSIRAAVARNEETPEEVLRELARDQDVSVRVAVAQNRQTPGEVLQTLAGDQDESVRSNLTENRHAPEDVFRLLATDQATSVRTNVARNWVAEEVLQLLAKDENKGIRAEIARNRRTPPETLQELSGDEDLWVRRFVAGNRRTPPDRLHLLARSPEVSIREAVAWNEQMREETLQALAKDEDRNVREIVAWNKLATEEILQALAEDTDEAVRKAVARNRQIPENILQTLTQDQAESVRRQAHLALRLLFAIKELPGEQEKKKISYRDILYAFDSERLVATSIEDQLKQVADLDISEPLRQKIFAILATDWDATKIRSSFEANDNDFLYQALHRLREDAQYILHPSMSAVALQKLAAFPRWEIRYLVALHKQTSRATRQALSQDGNRYVRAMARAKAAQMAE